MCGDGIPFSAAASARLFQGQSQKGGVIKTAFPIDFSISPKRTPITASVRTHQPLLVLVRNGAALVRGGAVVKTWVGRFHRRRQITQTWTQIVRLCHALRFLPPPSSYSMSEPFLRMLHPDVVPCKVATSTDSGVHAGTGPSQTSQLAEIQSGCGASALSRLAPSVAHQRVRHCGSWISTDG